MSEFKIPIENTTNYSFDKVSCFERPIVNQLNYINNKYGDFFIIISKLYQFYFTKKEKNTREEIIKISELILGVRYHSISSLKINKAIGQNYPVVLGVNLKFLFYSKYYCFNDWPHWFLVTGYDTERKIYNILDDVQYIQNENLYGEFVLTKSILKQLNKKYKEKYEKRWNCFYFELKERKSVYNILLDILDVYLEFDFSQNNSYPQLFLLKELSELYNQERKNSSLIEELKKKIVNSNKYRHILISELEKIMFEFNFEKSMICPLRELNQKLDKEWNSYITANILRILTNTEIEQVIPKSIIELEMEIKNRLTIFCEYLKLNRNSIESNKLSLYQSKRKPVVENDKNHTVELSKDRIKFSFSDDKTYNWWTEDNAPKVLMCDVLCHEDFEISTKIRIFPDFSCDNFQAGIFLRTENKNLFCAIDVNDLFVLDEIGQLNQSNYFRFQNDIGISVKKQGVEIIAKINDCTLKSLAINWFLETNENIDIGLACKTWGRKGKVKIEFYNFQVKKE